MTVPSVPPLPVPLAPHDASAPAERPAPLAAIEPRSSLTRPASAMAPFVVIGLLAVAFLIGEAMRGPVPAAEIVGALLVVLTAAVAVGVVLSGARSAARPGRPNLRLYAAGALICTLVVAAPATFTRGLASPYLAALPLGAAYLGLVLPRRTSAWLVAAMTVALVPLAIFGPPVTWLQALCIFVLVPGARFFGVLAGAAHRHAERVARQLTRADRLTRTLSRAGFLEELAHALVTLRRAHTPVALFLIDLNGLKEINSARGSAGGDELLAWCGQRLAEILPRGSSAGRLGGDEFGVAIAGMSRAEADRVAIELRDALDERHPVSIGVATSEDATVTVSDLLRVGNAALRRAKGDGDRRIHALVAGGVRPDAHAPMPESPVLTYERLRRNGGRPRKPSPTVLIGKFMSGGLVGLGVIGFVLSLLMLLTDATAPSLWTTVIDYGWIPWVAACFVAAVAARFVDPMNITQVNVLIVVATVLACGGTGVIALAQGGGLLEPIMAALALRVLFDTSVAYRPQAALTLGGTLVFLLAVTVLGPQEALRAAPYHLVLLGSAYALGRIAQQGFIDTTQQWLAVARTDVLTGLRNRLGVEEDAARLLRETAESGERLAIVSIDIDGMRAFNDQHGHPAGDAAIQRVAEALGSTFSAARLVGRLGADEFIVAVPVLSPSDADRLTATIEAVLRPELTVSAGVAVFPDHGRDLDGLLHVADVRRRSSKAIRRERAARDGAGAHQRPRPAA